MASTEVTAESVPAPLAGGWPAMQRGAQLAWGMAHGLLFALKGLMAAAWIQSLLSVVAVSLISLVGLLTLALEPSRVRRLAGVLVSFAVGALLGDAFLHLVPEIFAGPAGSALWPPLLVVGGMMLFFLVEKLLRHRHGSLQRGRENAVRRPELAAINVVGDGIHNVIDGVLIAASYLVSPVLGVSTTIAVLLHEVPQELGDFGVLVHSGLSVRRAILVNVSSASVAVAGAVSPCSSAATWARR
jgi:zinc and cadmium transporter